MVTSRERKLSWSRHFRWSEAGNAAEIPVTAKFINCWFAIINGPEKSDSPKRPSLSSKS